jgi:hypothetical protein
MKITPVIGRFAYLATLLLISGFLGRTSAQTAPPGPGDPNAPQKGINPNSGPGVTAASAGAAKGTGGASNQTAASAHPEDQLPLSATTPADQVAAFDASSAPLGVSPAAAKPYMTVTYRYVFPAPLAPSKGTYYLNCMRVDLADNSPDQLGQKNLDVEWRDNAITGVYSLRLPLLTSLYGTYSFRLFGPYTTKVDASTLPSPVPIPPGTKWVEVVQHGKLRDEGRFTFGPYQTVLTVPAEIPPRRRMTITWTDASVHQDAGIGLFKSGTDNQHPIARMMFANLPGSWAVDAPPELGSYEVRAFLNGGADTTGTRPFKVTWGTLQPVLSGFPATCFPFAYMPIDYANGPPEINAWIGIFDVTNSGTNTSWSWQDLQGKTSGELYLSAPATSGRYDIRMFDSANNLLARSAAFQVVPGSKTIQLNAATESGLVKLTWNNALGYQELDGYFVYRGTAAGAESATPLTVGPIPADRSAAAATAVNVHLDGGVQPGTKYFYVVKPLQMDHVTIGAASNEASVTAVAPAATASTSDAGGGTGGSGQPSTASTASAPPSGMSSTAATPVTSAAAGTRATPSSTAAAATSTVTAATGSGAQRVPTGRPAAPGRSPEMSQVYRLGESNGLTFALDRAEYEAGRLTFGEEMVAPLAGEKFFVVHFFVTNSRREPLQLNLAHLKWTVTAAQGATVTAWERLGLAADPGTYEGKLDPGKKAEGFAVFRVPAAGELQSLAVTDFQDATPATARYDLRGKVRALPAAFADAGDRSGATVAEFAHAGTGEAFACGRFDVVLESIEIVGADSPTVPDQEQGRPVYATVSYTSRGSRPGGVFGAGAPIVTLLDAQGGSHPAELQTFELDTSDTTELEVAPGATSKFRLRFSIPGGSTPRQVVFQELGGVPVRVDLDRPASGPH